MTQTELNEIIRLHGLWLQGDPSGRRADLRDADLRGADLRGADLRGADLCGADLCGAVLCDADLRDAVLCGAVLCDAVLRGADLCDADLRGADLCGADLCGAVLRGADLRGAVLRGADLCGADLRDAVLCGAVLRGAVLRDADLPHFQIPPESGGFAGYKKCGEGKVVTLYIPARARRTSSLIGRKCRAEYAKVISIIDADGRPCNEAASIRHGIPYRVGEIVRPDSYDDDIRIECTHGIHFFITRKEAEEYES